MISSSQKFTYLISERRSLTLPNNIDFAGFTISYSTGTDILVYDSNECSEKICIIGYCIDARGLIEKQSLASYLASVLIESNCKWSSFLEETYRLAGNYIVVVSCSKYFRVINDTVGYVGIYYNVDGLSCSSSDALLAMEMNTNLNSYAKEIRNGSSSDSQPLPYDITDYEGISICLPNFYLDFLSGETKRYFPSVKKESVNNKISVEECLSKSYFLINNIVAAYAKDFNLLCPLTSGWDSRLNYSFLEKQPSFKSITYTFLHPGFTDKTPDIYIPKMILKGQAQHKIIKDIEVPKSIYEKIKRNVTPNASFNSTSLAFTLLENFNNPAIINGDIVDQIGSSLIGQNLPNFFATKRFFKCKLHNYSSKVDFDLENWMSSIESKEISFFDLFSWESRLGRWAHESNKIYSAMGIVSLNIFNCREVINLWLQIPRSQRSNMIIHRYYFLNNNSSLIKIPFNPGSRYGALRI